MRAPRRIALVLASPCLGLGLAGPCEAQPERGRPASEKPAALREIGYDQRLGEAVPLDLVLRDEAGRSVRLGEALDGKPTVLALVYYECPMLCTLTLNGLVSALGTLSLEPGRDFSLVTVSFDDREGPPQAAQRKRAYLARYRRPAAERSWRFLTGERATLERLTKAVGFRYAWDEETRQFAHPAGVVVLTPEGKIARYLYGVEYAPKDLRLALVEASRGAIGSRVDQLLLYCYQYDPVRGRYGPAVMRIMRTAGALTVVGLAGLVGVMLRNERKGRR